MSNMTFKNFPPNTTSIDVYYNECIGFDFNDLDIEIERVTNWYVKYQTLCVTYDDGSQKIFSPTQYYDVDYKVPDEIQYND